MQFREGTSHPANLPSPPVAEDEDEDDDEYETPNAKRLVSSFPGTRSENNKIADNQIDDPNR
jgi:hypothetical protein